MQRYLVRTFATAALVLFAHCAIALSLPAPIYAEYWVRELIVIKQELAAQISSPKTIFLGGSSTLFNIDAERVERETGRPAFNMGLHASMRLSEVLALGSGVTTEGDTIVVMLEPGYYECDRRGWSEWQVRNALAWDRSNFDSLPLYTRAAAVASSGGPLLSAAILKGNFVTFVLGKVQAARKNALDDPEVIWERFRSGSARPDVFRYSAFNIDNHGTMLHTEAANFKGVGIATTLPARICPETVEQLREFVASMKNRKVSVLFANTPYLADDVNSAVAISEAEFAADIAEIGSTLIDRRNEMLFPRSDFFDTLLHLNSGGRALRTKKMIAALPR